MVSPRNALESLSARAAEIAPPPDLKVPRLQTEEAAKQALVLPFIAALGYDIFDHTEVVPEYTADFGTRQGEKVDYAIMSGGKPIIIFECKKSDDPLDVNRASQLGRYFHNTEARVGVLTGGLRYKFYSDLSNQNVMDQDPFLEFDIRMLDPQIIREVEGFAKGRFDIDAIQTAASKLRYINGIKEYLSKTHSQPGEEFVRLIANDQNFPGPGARMTTERLEYFTRLVGEAFQGFVIDRINTTLASAMARQSTTPVAEGASDENADGDDVGRSEGDIVTTVEEEEAYELVRAIVGSVVAPERVNIQDTRYYCAVVLDGNSRQTICRFRFGARVKYLCFGPATGEERHSLESLANISDHAEQLQETARRYLQG